VTSEKAVRQTQTFSGHGYAIIYHDDGSVTRYCSSEPGPPLTRERAKKIREKMAENKLKRDRR
jgi:hypothetical protein